MVIDMTGDVWQKMIDGPFLIAEAGKNFIQSAEQKSVEEYLNTAKKIVDEAVAGGADAIKWQTHNVEDEQLGRDVDSPHYQGLERYEWVRRNTISTPLDTFWRPLKTYCDDLGIVFMTTPMSRGAAQRVEDLDISVWKVGSADILDFVLLDYLRNTGKPIILSSGMSTFAEVEQAVSFVMKKNALVMVLHCVSQYPCPPEDLRLGTIKTLRQRLGIPIGFSDHSLGIESALVAYAAGASVVEKHFTLSRDAWGPDHKVSMTPNELKLLRSSLDELASNPLKKERMLESAFAKKALSQEEKLLQDEEQAFRPVFRKSLVAGQDIPTGTGIKPQMIYAMRPQADIDGLPSEKYDSIIGREVIHDLKKFDPIGIDDIK